MMIFLHNYLTRNSLLSIYRIVFLLILIIAGTDLLIGPEISTSILYLIPVAIASGYGNKKSALIASFAVALIWLLTDIIAAHGTFDFSVYSWNTLIRLGGLLFIALLLRRLHNMLNAEERAADTDELTGILNVRGFKDKLAEEYARSTRSTTPFSLAFIDIDNFKTVNDTLGHATGDILLITVAKTINDNLRLTDHIARLGGDEFVILFSETSEEIVKAAFTHVHKRLMETVTQHNWPVTFSVGVVSFNVLPESPANTIKIADEIMYGVKKSTKNNVVYTTWQG